VLPTYNNAATLAEVVERSLRLGVRTFVVNDGSTDTTAQVLGGIQDPGLRVLSHNQNQGKAAAMMTGFGAAAAEGFTHAATVDTDGQLDPEQVPGLLRAAAGCPSALVLGVRDFNIARCPSRSVIGRRAANFMIWMECGVRVTDSQCGLRVYPLGFIGAVPVSSGRFGFETEVITRAGWAGTPVVQVPVSCRYFEQRVTHFRPWLDTGRAVLLHARLLGRRMWPAPHARWPDGRKQAAGRGLMHRR
jgi:glycosyltransferase involved in cell wall biosynthesis